MFRGFTGNGSKAWFAGGAVLLLLGVYLFQLLCAGCYSYEIGSVVSTALLAATFCLGGVVVLLRRRAEDRPDSVSPVFEKAHLFMMATLTCMHVVTPIPAAVSRTRLWSACSTNDTMPVVAVCALLVLLSNRGSPSRVVRSVSSRSVIVLSVVFVTCSFFLQAALSHEYALPQENHMRVGSLPVCCQTQPARRILERSAWYPAASTTSFFCVRESCVVIKGSSRSDLLLVDVECDRFRQYEVSSSYHRVGFPVFWNLWGAAAILLLLVSLRCKVFEPLLLAALAAPAPVVGAVIRGLLSGLQITIWGCDPPSFFPSHYT